MLILTRRVGESVHIGDQVKVKVLTVRGNQVRLGIDAPREIKVNRDEVLNPQVKEQRKAPRTAPERPSPAESEPSSSTEVEQSSEED